MPEIVTEGAREPFPLWHTPQRLAPILQSHVRTGVNLASFAELAVRLVNSAVCDVEADPLRTPEAFREFVANRPFLAVKTTQYDLDRLRLLRGDLATVFTCAVEGTE